jgi:hypothetical protein
MVTPFRIFAAPANQRQVGNVITEILQRALSQGSQGAPDPLSQERVVKNMICKSTFCG